MDVSESYNDSQICLNNPLGMATGLIEEKQIRAKSHYNESTKPRYARLNGLGAWCPKQTPSQLQVDLSDLHYICAVATQGYDEMGYFTTKYKLLLRTGEKTDFYEDAHGNQVFFAKSFFHV